jgi:hypothetical protein
VIDHISQCRSSIGDLGGAIWGGGDLKDKWAGEETSALVFA